MQLITHCILLFDDNDFDSREVGPLVEHFSLVVSAVSLHNQFPKERLGEGIYSVFISEYKKEKVEKMKGNSTVH
jgi:hypothetical protein